MASWPSSSLAFGTPSSPGTSSVREAIASYRRAQYLVAGSAVASLSDESDELYDEEAQVSSTFEEEQEPEDNPNEDDLLTPTALASHDNTFVDQFNWDDFDDTQQLTAASPSIRFPSKPYTARRPPIQESTPLLKPKTSLRSISSGSHFKPSPREVPSYGLQDSVDASQHHPLTPRRVPTSGHGHHILFNSIAILLGIGMLSEPLAFAYAGWITGTILIILAKLLARVILTDPRLLSCFALSFSRLGKFTFVRLQGIWNDDVNSVVLVTLYADSLHAIIPGISSDSYKFWGLILLVPMVFLPLSLLSYTSILGIISTVMMVIVILYDGLTKSEGPGSLRDPAETSFSISGWTNLGLAYGLFMAGFSGHTVIPSLVRDMIDPSEFDRMINWAFLVATAIYAFIGYIGYLMFGSNVSDEISMDLLKIKGYNPTLNQALLWMLVISPLSKFALTTQPLNAVLEVLLGLESAAASPEDMAIKMSNPSPNRWTFKFFSRPLQRIIVTVAVVAVSIAVPEFSATMAFLGSFSAFMLCIIGPIAAKVALERKCGVLDAFILFIGTVFMVWGTVAAFIFA
ncbi:hypothetical protein D9757_006378 [Collybiopsis confluens]|uniref:Amino acid transporter transmembrane domain-containing protein n=1 Tax=Collybiopsis confluens TaxID=2823264 RepID=A0A8H5HGT1_9AGAR|nr:hypothetical protein D9757_006378 [Collybiopsis confluens]